jgi:hypothetical protein
MNFITAILYHILLYRVHHECAGFELTTLVIIGTDCIGSCKSNYYTTTTTTTPSDLWLSQCNTTAASWQGSPPVPVLLYHIMLYQEVWQWLATGRWFSPDPLVSSTNKTDCHDVTEILLKVALNTINLTPANINYRVFIDDLLY